MKKCIGLFLFIFAALIAYNPNNYIFSAEADSYNCFGPAPYNCYSNGDVDPTVLSENYATHAQAYAEFAWQDFIALNFPAALSNNVPTPVPSTTEGMNAGDGEYVAVWQTYTSASDMFRAGGVAPPGFGTGAIVPTLCISIKADTPPDLVLDEYIQANRMGPVVDQNGQYLRFSINFNSQMYDYIILNELYNVEGQEAFDVNNPNRSGSPVNWPRGVYETDVDAEAIGSIFVKTSWKILGSKDDSSTFFRAMAWVYNPAGGIFGDEPTVEESCTLQELGMTGMHIVHRTYSAPQFVWSTFEHIANAPWVEDFTTGTPTGPYSLFDPSGCETIDDKPSCSYNQVPDGPWNPDNANSSSQIIRTGAPGQYALGANNKYKGLLQAAYGSTVWDNYFLVDVQFPTKMDVTDVDSGLREVNPAYPDGLPSPSFLANSTMETYIQGFAPDSVTSNGNSVPDSDQMESIPGTTTTVDPWDAAGIYNRSGGATRNTSSCISCHADSAMVTGTFSDYVFSLNRAQSTENSNAK